MGEIGCGCSITRFMRSTGLRLITRLRGFRMRLIGLLGCAACVGLLTTQTIIILLLTVAV